MRHVIPDHAVRHAFLVVFIEVIEDDLPDNLNRLSPIFGQLR